MAGTGTIAPFAIDFTPIGGYNVGAIKNSGGIRMKSVLAVMFIAAVLLLSGCGQDLGIIGGADGPTAIIVSGCQ